MFPLFQFLGVAHQAAEFVAVLQHERAVQADGAGRHVFVDALAGRAQRFLRIGRVDQPLPGPAAFLVGGAALRAKRIAALMPGLEVGVVVFGLKEFVAEALTLFVHFQSLDK